MNRRRSSYRERDLIPSYQFPKLGHAKIVVANYHGFLPRERVQAAKLTKDILTGGNGGAFTETPDQVVRRVCRELGNKRNIIVLNDEAHHCYRRREAADEPKLDRDDREEAEKRNKAAQVWISGLEAVKRKIGIKAVYDLSATPLFLRGSGYGEGRLFPWVVSDFALIDAIESGIVKVPRVPMADDSMAAEQPTYRDLWLRIRDSLPKKGRRTDAVTGDPKVYVVQTNTKVIERCLLMTTDPGDSIARRADVELLYGQPYEDPKRVCVTGPFTVESLSPHRTISVEQKKRLAEQGDAKIGLKIRSLGPDHFGHIILENLRAAGVQNTYKKERLKFDTLDPFPGEWIHGAGTYTDSDGKMRRVAVCIGPEHGTVGPQLVKEAAKEAVQGVGFDVLVICGFAFDPHVTEEGKRYGKLVVLPTRMNPDLAMGELLKKTGSGNLFMVFGEPDLKVTRQKDGRIVVEIKGLDEYDPTTAGAARAFRQGSKGGAQAAQNPAQYLHEVGRKRPCSDRATRTYDDSRCCTFVQADGARFERAVDLRPQQFSRLAGDSEKQGAFVNPSHTLTKTDHELALLISLWPRLPKSKRRAILDLAGGKAVQ